jgi:hypothetical protein
MSKKATQIGLHTVKNLLGEPSQLDLFSTQAEDFAQEYNTPIQGKIDRFGIDLTDMQSRVMEGILRGFSECKYEVETRAKEHICSEKYAGKVPPAYKNIKAIPVLKATQSQILTWAGIKKNSIASWGRAVEAIDDLGSTQFCFYYKRLCYDDSGRPLKDKNGKWIKEEVYCVDTLFTIKKIKTNDKLDYYEIYPSSIFLDQLDSYFMFIPFNWREEVCAIIGNKKISSYTFRFLLFLRYQYELMRRNWKEKPYIFKKTQEEIAIALKMPESVYRRKAQRASQLLQDAYDVALKLGYLASFERNEVVDTFVLNTQKFFDPMDISLNQAVEAMVQTPCREEYLLEFFMEQRRQFDPHHREIALDERKEAINEFKQLLATRAPEDIEKTLKWAIKKKFWASHTTTPKDFAKNFDKIWADMSSQTKESKESIAKKNKSYVETHIKKFDNASFNGVKLDVLSKSIELTSGVHATVIAYDDAKFEEKLTQALHKWNIHHLLFPS